MVSRWLKMISSIKYSRCLALPMMTTWALWRMRRQLNIYPLTNRKSALISTINLKEYPKKVSICSTSYYNSTLSSGLPLTRPLRTRSLIGLGRRTASPIMSVIQKLSSTLKTKIWIWIRCVSSTFKSWAIIKIVEFESPNPVTRKIYKLDPNYYTIRHYKHIDHF